LVRDDCTRELRERDYDTRDARRKLAFDAVMQ